ncbi:MAG: AgmX/PglI C-terminal domain-containing protein [Myxococcota bacterium]
MRRVSIALLWLLAASTAAGQPAKLTFKGVIRTESTRALEPRVDAPRPRPPLSTQQQALLSGARVRFTEIADAEKLPRACSSEIAPRGLVADDSRFTEEVVLEPLDILFVTLRLWSRVSEWQGKGCCPPCERPCEPTTCGYCSPADSCKHLAHERELEVRFRITAAGRVLSEDVVRAESKPVEVKREAYVPPPVDDGTDTTLTGLPNVRGIVSTSLEPGPGMDRQKAEQYVRARKSALQACYERELRRFPGLSGRLVVSAVVTPTGRSTGIELKENTLGNDAIGSCVKTVLRGWVWPFKPGADSPFTFTVNYVPGS